jgi:hypothetical protein
VIQDDPSLARDVKMIGIALGSNQALTNAYKKTCKAVFPIFPDEQLDIGSAVEIQETPTLVLMSNSGKTLAFHRGALKDMDGFLKELREIYKSQ